MAQQAFDSLEPGGWFESQEIDAPLYCDDGTLHDNSPLRRWNLDMIAASEAMSRPLAFASKVKGWYEEVGFVDVQERSFKVPLNTWPKDRWYKEIGNMWEKNMLEGLSGFSLALFNRAFGRSAEEIEVSAIGSRRHTAKSARRILMLWQLRLVDVRKGISDLRIHAYHRFYVVVGRKPYPYEAPRGGRSGVAQAGDATMAG
jgi:hypothetical protein